MIQQRKNNGLFQQPAKAPFVPSLFVEIRRRTEQKCFRFFPHTIINSIEEKMLKRECSRSKEPVLE
jgi:hypothetical protein